LFLRASDQDLIERLLIENSSSDALGTGAIKLKQQKDELNEENDKLLLEMSVNIFFHTQKKYFFDYYRVCQV